MSESKEQQFWNAARAGDLSVVQNLTTDTTLDINWQGFGCTPLNIACFDGRASVVQFLLALTAVEVNKPNDNGFTPFFFACQQGHRDVVSLLLADTRIDVNKSQSQGGTPFYIACEQGHSCCFWLT